MIKFLVLTSAVALFSLNSFAAYSVNRSCELEALLVAQEIFGVQASHLTASDVKVADEATVKELGRPVPSVTVPLQDGSGTWEMLLISKSGNALVAKYCSVAGILLTLRDNSGKVLSSKFIQN